MSNVEEIQDKDEQELKSVESAETNEFEDTVLKDPKGAEYIRPEEDQALDI